MSAKDRIHPTKPRTCCPSHLHHAFMLDTILQDWAFEYRRLGRGPLRKVWIALLEARVLLRCASSTRKDASRPSGSSFRLRRAFRLQVRRGISGKCTIHRDAHHAGDVRCCDGSPWLVHRRGTWDEQTRMSFGRIDVSLWCVFNYHAFSKIPA